MLWRLPILFCLGSLLACRPDPPPLVVDPVGELYEARGRELVEGLAACGFCHGEQPLPRAPMSGGQEFADSFGALRAANITPSTTGIGEWNVGDLVRLIRSARSPRGEYLSTEVHRGFEWLSENDLLAVIAYIRTFAPVDNEVPRRPVGFVERHTTGLFHSWPEVRGYVPDIRRRHREQYGRYLVDHVARCGACHTAEGGLFSGADYLAGGKEIERDGEIRYAPSLTGSEVDGLGAWREEDIVTYLQSGVTPSGRVVDPRFCPHQFYANADIEDLRAIAHYLKSIR